MKIYNRLLVSILAVCLVFSILVLTSCNNNQNTSSSSSSGYTSEEISNATTYTLNVKYHAVNEDLTKNTTITYHTLYGFSAYSLQEQRFYYTFKGLEYNGVVYYISGQDYVSSDNKTLSNAIKMQQNKTLDMTAVWECEFQSMYLNISAFEERESSFYPVYFVVENSDPTAIVLKDIPVFFVDASNEDCYDTQDNIFKLFIEQYEDIRIYTTTTMFYKANFSNLAYVSIDGVEEGRMYLTKDEFNFQTIISYIKFNKGTLDNLSNIEISISFIFEKGEIIA